MTKFTNLIAYLQRVEVTAEDILEAEPDKTKAQADHIALVIRKRADLYADLREAKKELPPDLFGWLETQIRDIFESPFPLLYPWEYDPRTQTVLMMLQAAQSGEGKPTIPPPVKPSKDDIKACQLVLLMGKTQVKASEIMENELEKPFPQYRVSRAIKRVTKYAKIIGINLSDLPLKKGRTKIIPTDPADLEQGPRLDKRKFKPKSSEDRED
jgi:hypothetical protein